MSSLRVRLLSQSRSPVLWLVAAALLSTAIGCKPETPPAVQLPTPKVTVTPVVAKKTIDADEYIGRTEGSEIVEVRARVFGYLKSVEFADGDYVREGQTLFTIEPDEYQAIHQQSLSRVELNTAQNQLARANLARKEKLVGTGVITREEHDELIAAVKETDAKINAAKADAARTAVDLKYTVLKAPISGRIDRAFVSKGNLLTGGLSSGTLLTKIVAEQPMYVYFDVDERSLLRYMRQRPPKTDSAPGSLRDLGMACYLQLADEKTFSHQGQLDFAASEVNATTGTARIRGVFANEDLRPGEWSVCARSCSSEPAVRGSLDSRTSVGRGSKYPFRVCGRRGSDGGTAHGRTWRTTRRQADRDVGFESGRARHRERPAARPPWAEGGSRIDVRGGANRTAQRT